MNKKLFMALSVASMAMASTQALQIVDTDTTVPDPDTTNWSKTLTVNQFDPSLGVLTGITVHLEGHVGGASAIKVESLDNAASVVNSTLKSVINLDLPAGGQLSVAPASANVDNFTAFDGVIDFGGTSGNIHNNLSASDTDQVAIPVADWAAFIGLGTVNFPVEALGASTASGAGNLITQFATQAGATVTVTYDYRTHGVPDAGATCTLLGGALLAFGAIRRKF